jgi:DNA-binding CsgD family transcriptional regulator
MQLTKFLSERDTLVLLDLINKSTICADEQAYHNLMCGLKTLIPYENAISVLGGKGRDGGMQYHAITLSCPPDKREHDRLDRCDHQEAVKKKKFAQFPVPRWDGAFSKFREDDFISVTCDGDVRNGCTYGMQDWCGEGGIISISGDFVKQNRRTTTILEFAAPHLHQALSRTVNEIKRHEKSCSVLSPKEMEVLKWLKQGKSTWDMAAILRISERTVKFHISNIIKKLNASNRAHALAIAIEQKLLYIT